MKWMVDILMSLTIPELLRNTAGNVQLPVKAGKEVVISPKRIVVVGGGAAGISFLKVVREFQEQQKDLNWDVVLYEQRDDMGGIWYEQKNKPDPPILPESSIYPRLRTNTPHPHNTYYKFPFPPGTDLYPIHTKLHEYMKDTGALELND
ncbi:uncharacterized protein EI90DRAFT_3005959, partial [Cantharellus anzutake]|uniref:uncharacterized protein n=1 Tax=Cantharellus anzutake TaxID=1750568 RepID=UPI001908577A